MKSRKLRLWLAVIVFFLSLVLWLSAALPTARQQQSVPLPAVTLPVPNQSWCTSCGPMERLQ